MEQVIEVPFVISVTVAILCVFAGSRINRSLSILHEWNIPDVVTGGLIAAAVSWLLFQLAGVRLEYDLSARDLLLLYFFTSIGLNIKLSDVMKGGRPLAILLGLTAILMIIQNIVATAGAKILSLPAGMNILLGSLALSGGHGTAIAWAPIVDTHFGIHHSLEIGIAVATLGLVVGSLLGGPIAHVLMARNKLSGSMDRESLVGLPEDLGRDYSQDINHLTLMGTILTIHIAILLGYFFDILISELGIQMPLFVSSLIIAIVIANLIPIIFPNIIMPARSRSLALVSDVALNLFLALSLMSMQLWLLVSVGIPILIIFAVHAILIILYIFFLVFPLMGKDYDAVVISSGFTGIGLGSTATAFANMAAVTSVHGASLKAHMILSLVAALFLDVANSALVAWIMG